MTGPRPEALLRPRSASLLSLCIAFAVVAPGCSGSAPEAAGPTLSALFPTSGDPSGATVVTLSGRGFEARSSVTFGGVAAAVRSVSAGVMVVDAPPHAVGVVDVTVTDPERRSSTLHSAFTYSAAPPPVTAPPVLAAVSPPGGDVVGGTTVVLAGTGFAPGATVTFDGLAAVVVRASATSIAARTPAHAVGAVDVAVRNPDGQRATLPVGFAYRESPRPPPLSLALDAVVPATGSTGGGDAVALAGSGFAEGAQVAFGGAFATVLSLGPTSIVVTAPPGAPGAVDVTVTNPDSAAATLPGGYTYVAPPPPPPKLDAVLPSAGAAAGGTPVTLSGTGFAPGALVTFGGAPAQVVSLEATAVLVAAPPHEPGPVEVAVANPDGRSTALAGAFSYAAPTATGDAQYAAALAHYGAAGVDVTAAIAARNAGDAAGAAALFAAAQAEYAAARTGFDALALLFPSFARLDEAAYLAGRSSYEIAGITGLAADYADARARLDAMQAAFPASPSLPDAAFFDGRARFELGDHAGARAQLAATLAAAPAGTFADNAQYYLGRSWYESGVLLANATPAPLPGTPAFAEAKAHLQAAQAEFVKVAARYPVSTFVDNATYYQGLSFVEEPVDPALGAERAAHLATAIGLFGQVVGTAGSFFVPAARYARAKALYAHAFVTAVGGVKNQADLAAAIADLDLLAPPSVYADNALYYLAKCFIHVDPGPVCTGAAGSPPTSACAAVAALTTLAATDPAYLASPWPALAATYVADNGCVCPR